MPNSAKVWDGTQWVPCPHKVYNAAGEWVESTPKIWDGAEWRSSAPVPYEYPEFVEGGYNSGVFDGQTIATLPIPSGDLRMSDLVVSICAAYGGQSDPTPTLVRPRHTHETFTDLDPSQIRIAVAMFPWSPDRGTSVTWKVEGQSNVTVCNLLYRYAEVTAIPDNPKFAHNTAQDSGGVDVPTNGEYLDLYVALGLHDTVGAVVWPDGLHPRGEEMGQWGTEAMRLAVADAAAAPTSPGKVYFNGTLADMAVAGISIPGRKGSGPQNWVLGSPNLSTLGYTTVLT